MNFLARFQCEATKWQKAFMFKNIAAQNETQVHTPFKCIPPLTTIRPDISLGIQKTPTSSPFNKSSSL